MIVLGVDTSSSCCGHALVDRDELVDSGVWEPTKAEAKTAGVARLWSYYMWLNTYVGLRRDRIDMAAIEELAVVRGAKTVRVLAAFETIALLVCKKHNIPIIRVKAGEARHHLLGLPVTCSKEEAHMELKRQYPDLKLPRKGGPDVADAFIAAKAGPSLVGS